MDLIYSKQLFKGIEKLKQNPEELERIIKNHIVRGKVIKGL